MSESKEKLHLTEIITGVISLIGLCLGFIAWWSGETIWTSLGQFLIFFLAAGLNQLVGEGLRTGKLGIKGGDVYRDKNPLVFWIFVLFYIGVGLSLLVIGSLYLVFATS